MKKWLLYPVVILFSFLTVTILIIGGILFYDPTILINPPNIEFALVKTKVLKSWSWKNAKIDHKWVKWNERILSGRFDDLCFEYESSKLQLKTCLEEVSWHFNLNYNVGEGIFAQTIDPFFIRSSDTVISYRADPEPDSGPPNIYGHWSTLWSPVMPDFDFNFKKITLKLKDKDIVSNLVLIKKPKHLEASTFGFDLKADPEKFEITHPAPYKIPKDLKLSRPIHLKDLNLKGKVSKKGIPLKLRGLFEVIPFGVDTYLDLPVKDEFSSVKFQKKILLKTTAFVKIEKVKSTLESLGPKPYNVLPAPLNVMDGVIDLTLKTKSHSDKNSVEILVDTLIDLKSEKQALNLLITTSSPLDLKKKAISAITVGIDFLKVALLMPRLSKKSLPPQFMPDNRITNTPYNPKPDPKVPPSEKTDLNLHLEALGEKALHIKTNLIDEIIRLNFDLNISDGKLKTGFVELLPLKTKVFKRPIQISFLKITFQAPLEPIIETTIHFLLPEYKITMKLEGPLSNPRYAFSSRPPLPQSDIYAVLFFGRPLSDLDPDDKSAASRTNQILSQGILSLSVLYFFAGSPIEYVGYDPSSKNASAQIGLGSKNSLKIGGTAGGVNSTAVRRSLGKGWYLDTSVQKPGTLSTSDSNNYGVLLERIIAY